MNWLSDITPPGIKKMFKVEDDKSDALWVKCPSCSEMVFHRELVSAQHVCPNCGHHMPIPPAERLAHLFDGGIYDKIRVDEVHQDPLKFKDEKKYTDRLKDARKKTSEQDAMIVSAGTIGGVPTVAAVQNFAFMGGSMGMGVGEALIKAAETALERRAPLIVFSASGGARMQEGILSLMQMPRSTISVQMMREAGLPYIVVQTHPTTGGVTASYAMLGDVHLAEPGALIGFAGPRVIEQTIREKLPEGFQRSEYLFEKGMVDMVVHRQELRSVIARLIGVLMKADVSSAADAPAAPAEQPVKLTVATPGPHGAAPKPAPKAPLPPVDEAAE